MFSIKEESFNTSQDFLRKIQSLYSVVILPPMGLTTVLFIVQVQQQIKGIEILFDGVAGRKRRKNILKSQNKI